jgi:ribosome-binding protein aMBF1 (putative translation factor)
MNMAQTKEALAILDRVTGKNSTIRRDITNARINLEVAQMIYDARTDAGLSQRELAERIGSRQSVIARLEDADYTGHSLSMLQRIGNALGQRLELRFVSASRRGPRTQGLLPSSRRLLRRA